MTASAYPATRGRAILMALAAAALFGLSTPAAKALLALSEPALLAGLLYLGSGVGLGLLHLVQRRRPGLAPREATIPKTGWPWLALAIAAGGVAGPLLLMLGLAWGTASEVALLLNLESVFTAGLAWGVFREHVDRRIGVGMAAVTAGAVALAFEGWHVRLSASAVLVAGACAAWALDNNVTRKVATSDPLQIVALKGLVAGAVNTGIAVGLGARLPGAWALVGAAVVGFLGYGVSLVLFVLALRHLGTARAGAYFSTAPFLGALASVLVLGDPVTPRLAVAAVLMAIGVWLHATERHHHDHVHAWLEHDHAHHHDAHHQHAHPSGVPSGEPHAHPHRHTDLRHEHPHYPDVHHRHEHRGRQAGS